MPVRLTVGYVAALVVLAGAVLAVPAADAVVWAVTGVVSVGAVLLGVRRHGPRPRGPWLLLAAALLAQAAGDTSYAAMVDRPGEPSPPIADLCYVAMFPLLATGLVWLTRPTVLIRDRSALLDLLTFVVVAGLLCWILIAPALDATGVDAVDRSLLASYLLGGLVLIIIMLMLLITVRRSPAVLLLTVGAAGGLAADTLYGVIEVEYAWVVGNPAELGWLVMYGTWGAAALHPSMARLLAPPMTRHGDLSRGRIVLLGLASLAPCAVLLIEAGRGEIRDGVVLAVASGLLVVLVFSRFSDVVETHRQAVDRERSLREAGAALVAATTVGQIGVAVRIGVARLVPILARHQVVFAVGDRDGVPEPVGSDWGRYAAAEPDLAVHQVGPRSYLISSDQLYPRLAEELGGHEVALVCPLRCDGGATRVGVLVVVADELVLAAIRDSIEILAVQVTLALERIVLTDRVSRGDSEHYFHAVARNTSDVVLIVDEDDRIRYASPSLTALIGAEAPAFGSVTDLAPPDGRERITGTLRRVRADRNGVAGAEEWLVRHRDGRRIEVEVTCRDLRADRVVRGLVITIRDLTERRLRERDLIRQMTRHTARGRNRASVASRFRW